MSRDKTVTFGCLIDMDVIYIFSNIFRPLANYFLSYILKLFHYYLALQMNTSYPHHHHFIRQNKIDIQNFLTCKCCHVRCHTNWVQEFHLILYLDSLFLWLNPGKLPTRTLYY